VLAVVSLSWVAVVDLTPPQKRPYAGTTDTNSALELAVGPYGIGRFVRQTRPSVVAVASTRAVPAPLATGEAGAGPRYGFSRAFVATPAGPLRLIDGQLAGQVLWLFPLVVAGVILGARGERIRRPLAPSHLALMLWSGWALTYGVIYSAAGGIFHFYYMSTLAPPLAALAGIGAAHLVRLSIAGGWRAALVAVAVLGTAGWQLFIDARALDGFDGWHTRLHDALVAGALVGASGLVAFARPSVWGRAARALAAGAVGVGLASALVIPAAWAMSSVLVPGRGTLPSADLARLLPDDVARRPSDTTAMVSPLIAFLTANRGEEKFMLAASSATLAAPIIVRTGQPVMARGGFHGLDPILTPQKLADMAAAKQVRFVMLGDLSGVSRRMGAETAQRPIAEWILANGKLVDPKLWNTANALGGQMRLYDLRPE
jgi:4-amino-4-deoxy-L-arabinose transferase-like glycosyltransferase